MTGSNARGMTGSNARGMTGSNARGMTGSNARASSAGIGSGFGTGFSVAAMGALESIAIEKDLAHLTVAGQVFDLPSNDASLFSVGDYIVAGGATGAMAIVYHTGIPYIAGVSTVRVKACVDSVNQALGSLTVGGLTVDYAAQLALNPGLAPSHGDVVEVSGVQPTAGGTLLVSSAGGGLAVAPAATMADRR
jgi:hypothetical protein